MWLNRVVELLTVDSALVVGSRLGLDEASSQRLDLSRVRVR